MDFLWKEHEMDLWKRQLEQGAMGTVWGKIMVDAVRHPFRFGQSVETMRGGTHVQKLRGRISGIKIKQKEQFCGNSLEIEAITSML